MKLLEVLDKPLDVKIFKNTDRSYYGQSIINDRKIVFALDRWPEVGKWNFTFYQLNADGNENYDEGLYNKTGSGKEFAVFATAKVFLEAAIKEKKPVMIHFDASTTEGSSRAKLYKRFTERWQPVGYVHRIVHVNQEAEYHAFILKTKLNSI